MEPYASHLIHSSLLKLFKKLNKIRTRSAVSSSARALLTICNWKSHSINNFNAVDKSTFLNKPFYFRRLGKNHCDPFVCWCVQWGVAWGHISFGFWGFILFGQQKKRFFDFIRPKPVEILLVHSLEVESERVEVLLYHIYTLRKMHLAFDVQFSFSHQSRPQSE